MPAKSKLRAAISLLRLEQSYKAIVVWLPSLFYGQKAYFIHGGKLLLLMAGWILLSQIIYIFNDLIDLSQDRKDPDRGHRALASGAVSPGQAIAVMGLAALALALVLVRLDPASMVWFGIYAGINLCYSLGLKKQIGVRQALVAIGFWLRLQSGGEPGVPIFITPWAAMFTLGLAYYLNALKGFGKIPETDGAARWAAGTGAILAGALALVALATLCLKRGAEGTLARPELPPLVCLVGMHRFAHRNCFRQAQKEQAWAVFRDPWIMLTMALFVLTLAWK